MLLREEGGMEKTFTRTLLLSLNTTSTSEYISSLSLNWEKWALLCINVGRKRLSSGLLLDSMVLGTNAT